MSRKRRRSQAFAEPGDDDDEVEQEPTEQELEARKLEKEREVWEAVKEEHFEVVDQVPLTLHRQFTLMRELDQQTHGCLDDIVPMLKKYIAYRRDLGIPATSNSPPAPTSITEPSVPPTPVASTSASASMPALSLVLPKTPLRAFQAMERTPRTPTPMSIPAERIKPPQTGKEMLSHIAWLSEELMSAAQEKVNLAQAAHHYVSRQIQVVGQAIKEQETSIALGVRLGTQLAPILLPEIAPPSRWTARNAPGTLVLDDDDNEENGTEETPTTLGIPVDEAEQPPKRTRARKGGRSSTVEGEGKSRTMSLKITLPAMHDSKPYCYCQKPSDGEMVACDNQDCQLEWFHLTCTDLTRLPEEEEIWYCRNCDPTQNPPKKKGRRR